LSLGQLPYNPMQLYCVSQCVHASCLQEGAKHDLSVAVFDAMTTGCAGAMLRLSAADTGATTAALAAVAHNALEHLFACSVVPLRALRFCVCLLHG
jgi:hypothetical protein